MMIKRLAWSVGAAVLLIGTAAALKYAQGLGLVDAGTVKRVVQVMIGLYLVMLALFLRIQALQLPELRRAIEAQDWPTGGAVLARIRRLVGINLLVGLALVSIAAARPGF